MHEQSEKCVISEMKTKLKKCFKTNWTVKFNNVKWETTKTT